jgi:hypothetical protein
VKQVLRAKKVPLAQMVQRVLRAPLAQKESKEKLVLKVPKETLVPGA